MFNRFHSFPGFHNRRCDVDCDTFPFPYTEISREPGLPVTLQETYNYVIIDELQTNILSVTSLTRVASVATAVTLTPHFLSNGQVATISGAVETDYNGEFVVTVVDDTTFTYTVTGSPSTPATGTIIATYIGVKIKDAEIVTSFILASMECFEKISRRVLINVTFETLRSWWERCFELRKSPFVSTTSVKFNDENDVEQTVLSTDFYNTVDPFYSKLIFLDEFDFPRLSDREQSIKITFVAGFGVDETTIPNDIKLAIKAHVAFLWENRGDCPDASADNCLPCQSRTTFQKYKVTEI